MAVAAEHGTYEGTEYRRLDTLEFQEAVIIGLAQVFALIAGASVARASRLPRVVTYALDGPAVGPREERVLLSGTVPDGLALDADGALYMSCWRPDRVYRLLPNATDPEIHLDDPTAEYMNSPTNLCFGGEGLGRIYLAGLCGWAIREMDADTPGKPLVYPYVP